MGCSSSNAKADSAQKTGGKDVSHMLHKAFQPYKLGDVKIKNRICMAAMTRCRADPQTGVPTDLMVQYYSERAASAGFVTTECSYVSLEGHGFPGAPGIATQEHVAGWKKVTKAVHDKGGVIFCQIYHCGRGVKATVKNDGEAIAPSPIAIRSDKEQHPIPREMTIEDIKKVIEEFTTSFKRAKEAGFDGIEIHAANGYLIDEFIRDYTNQRKDDYGGSVENRCRFCLEIVDAAIKVIGAGRVGIKFAPTGRFQDMFDSDPLKTYSYLLAKLNEKRIAYVLISETESWMKDSYHPPGLSQIENCAQAFRPQFKGTFITNGELTIEEAKRRLNENEADLACFGKNFISNPDLVERLKNQWELSPYDWGTFYGGGEKGYTDYPKYTPKKEEPKQEEAQKEEEIKAQWAKNEGNEIF